MDAKGQACAKGQTFNGQRAQSPSGAFTPARWTLGTFVLFAVFAGCSPQSSAPGDDLQVSSAALDHQAPSSKLDVCHQRCAQKVHAAQQSCQRSGLSARHCAAVNLRRASACVDHCEASLQPPPAPEPQPEQTAPQRPEAYGMCSAPCLEHHHRFWRQCLRSGAQDCASLAEERFHTCSAQACALEWKELQTPCEAACWQDEMPRYEVCVVERGRPAICQERTYRSMEPCVERACKAPEQDARQPQGPRPVFVEAVTPEPKDAPQGDAQCRQDCEFRADLVMDRCVAQGDGDEACAVLVDSAVRGCFEACAAQEPAEPEEAPAPEAPEQCMDQCRSRAQDAWSQCMDQFGQEDECQEINAVAMDDCRQECEP